MLAGMQRIADVLERMADLKSGSQNLWMDGVKMRIRKGRKLDLEWTEWKRKFARKSQMIVIQSPPISASESG